MYSYVWSKYIYRICTWFLLNVKENNSVHLFYNNPKFFNTFRIISDPLEPFAPNSLGPFQLLQRHFLLFFWLRSRSISSLSLLFSNLVCNFLSFFVPQPVMVVKFNTKYLEIPKEAIWYLLRFSNLLSMHSSVGRWERWALWILAVEQKRRGSCIQDSRKGAKDLRCFAI